METSADLATVIFWSLLGGVVSLLGGLLLLSSKSVGDRLYKWGAPFAAGALLAAAFLDLLPEGIEHGTEPASLFIWTLAGILVFFILERFIRVFHHHHEHKGERDPRISLVIVGDTIHNFIDGLAIGAGFLVSVPTGIIVTLAVATHEIPQEIGDFGLLLKKGLEKKKVILVNILSALATTIAAVMLFQTGGQIEIGALMGMTAGFFIYIAVSDIIPSIHESKSTRAVNVETVLLLLGVVAVGLLTTAAHDFVETNTEQPEDYVEVFDYLDTQTDLNENLY